MATVITMYGSVFEIHADTSICTENVKVVWGELKDTIAFIFTTNYIKLYMTANTKEDELIESMLPNDSNQRSILRTDGYDRYVVKIVVGDKGYIIFISNLTTPTPQFVLNFVPGFKLCN